MPNQIDPLSRNTYSDLLTMSKSDTMTSTQHLDSGKKEVLFGIKSFLGPNQPQEKKKLFFFLSMVCDN